MPLKNSLQTLRSLWPLGVVFLAGVWSGCAPPMPVHPVERALYRDARQVIVTQERTGWAIDAVEVGEISGTILESVCQVAPARREGLLEFLDRQILAEGGPAAEAYLSNGGDLGEVSEILTLERMRLAVAMAGDRALDDCPFWLEVDREFAGVQLSQHRFVLLAESIGGMSLVVQDSELLLGGGGGGRLMPGWGVDENVTLALGLEVSGGGTFAAKDLDDSLESIDTNVTAAIPMFVRIHSGTWLFDFEAAMLIPYRDGLDWPPGFRVAFATGLGAVRIAGIMPQGLAWIGYEFFPEDGKVPAAHMIRLGTRVGVELDP